MCRGRWDTKHPDLEARIADHKLPNVSVQPMTMQSAAHMRRSSA
jgi:hypothetical protein